MAREGNTEKLPPLTQSSKRGGSGMSGSVPSSKANRYEGSQPQCAATHRGEQRSASYGGYAAEEDDDEMGITSLTQALPRSPFQYYTYHHVVLLSGPRELKPIHALTAEAAEAALKEVGRKKKRG